MDREDETVSEESARLHVELDGKEVTQWLTKDSYLIGRSKKCDICFENHTDVSRRHVRLERSVSGWKAFDLGATNRLTVNGTPVVEHELSDGDILQIASVRAVFRAAPPSLPIQERVVFDSVSAGGAPAAEIPLDMFSSSLGPNRSATSSAGVASSHTMAHHIGAQVVQPFLGAWVVGLFGQMAESLLTSRSLDDMLEKVADLLFETIPCQRALICLVDSNTGELIPKVVRTPLRGQDQKIVLSQSVTSEVIRSKKAVLISDAGKGPFQHAASLIDIRSVLCSPLCYAEQVSGLIYVDTYDLSDAFTEEHLSVFSTMAVLAAVGVQQAELREVIAREQLIRDRLARYSPSNIVEQIVQSSTWQSVEMIAEEKEVSVLFADFSGFTTMSETKTPAQVTEILNEYLGSLTEVIFRFDGTLDKYTGDGLMAFFGAPIDQDDHARRAIDAALAMQAEMESIHRRHPDWPHLLMRIGVNSGPVIAGDIGSPRRKDYTVIGDVVNVASRLESSVAKPGEVVIGPRTKQLVGESYPSSPLNPMKLKGKQAFLEPFLLRREQMSRVTTMGERPPGSIEPNHPEP